jgi:hypothetical protein
MLYEFVASMPARKGNQLPGRLRFGADGVAGITRISQGGILMLEARAIVSSSRWHGTHVFSPKLLPARNCHLHFDSRAK